MRRVLHVAVSTPLPQSPSRAPAPVHLARSWAGSFERGNPARRGRKELNGSDPPDRVGSIQKFLIEPSGMIVLLKIAPVKSAPLVTALRRLALVRSAERNCAWVKLALVKIPLKRSTPFRFARVRFAAPKLISSRIEVVNKVFVRFAPTRFAPMSRTVVRLA